MFRIYFLFLFLTFLKFDAFAQSNAKAAMKPVKIGLLIADKNAVAAKNGAELAILQANEKGGFQGQPFELVVRSMEGPWGTGAKEAVNLIFKDEVIAILGSTDGRNAHLVEQVTTKSHIVFLSAWAGDPTLSQAFVPWFFSCVPNNNQQAVALVDEIRSEKNLLSVALVSDLEYDSQSILKSYMKRSKIAGNPDPLQYNIDGTERAITDLVNKLEKAGIKSLVMFVKTEIAVKIADQFRLKKMNIQLFSTQSVLNEDVISDFEMNKWTNQIQVSSSQWSNSTQNTFRTEFQNKFGHFPGTVATFTYDGMNLLIESVRKAGFEREKIQRALSEIHYEGVTGLIQFDQKGNRSGTVVITPVKNGTPALLSN